MLQERVITRIGGNEPIKVDARIIAASNRNLQDHIKEGRFREDLFYRLNVMPINLPSLRDRKEDIPPLADFMLNKFNKLHNRTIKGIAKDALAAMRVYSWPGNIRQLENEIQRMCILSDSEILETTDLSDEIQKEVRESGLNTEVKGKLKESIDSLEKDQIQNQILLHALAL